MKIHTIFIVALLSILLYWGCGSLQENKSPSLHPSLIGEITHQMTELMIHDVTNPPLAARFFSYACLAGYEVIAQNDTTIPSMHQRLNGYPEISKPENTKESSISLSAALAMLQIGKKMQPSGTELQAFETHLLDSCKELGFSEEAISQSLKYAQTISQEIMAYAAQDGYNKISNYPRYTPLETEGSWYPTPPGYFPPVEPYFDTVRPFTLDSASQFKPAPPAPFSKEPDSEFYKMTEEIFKIDLSGENREIAAFWDCNPFALQDNGHLMIGMKKISPGAHWMGITNIACQQAELSFSKAMEINTWVAIGLMDGFIACWDEKYRSNRIRPETAIRKHFDPSWTPLLQTPPFPEYLSGHSTISTAAAIILTEYFGENFTYTDTVEERYGLEARQYDSFNEAAQEAAISRLYGGIHFMDAIVNGQKQGHKVGNWVIKKIN